MLGEKVSKDHVIPTTTELDVVVGQIPLSSTTSSLRALVRLCQHGSPGLQVSILQVSGKRYSYWEVWTGRTDATDHATHAGAAK